MSTKKPDGEAFARLRAADPAADLTPDHDALRHAVTARSTVVDELAPRRRRSARALQVAAASAGALAIGASGFALGGGFAASVVASPAGAESAASGDAGGALPPITLDRPSGERVTTEGSDGAMAPEGGMGGGGAEFSTEPARDMAYTPGYFGRTVFTQSGLSTSGGSAAAYGYDAKSVYSEDTVQDLAAALGVEGKVRDSEGYLLVGDQEGREPNLSVYADGSASFYYYDPTKDVWACDGEGDGECQERDLGDAVQGDDAREAATEILVKLGVDPASVELEVSDASAYDSKDYSTVSAFRVIDGQRTGDQWGVSFTGDGAQSVWGSLANLVELGEYDVVSPAEAVERLGDPRFGATNSVYPMDWMGPASLERGESARGGVPSVPTPGTSFDWTVENVTIVSDRLGLAQHHLDDGSVVLVPTYELSAKDGRTWSVIAVADSHLDFS